MDDSAGVDTASLWDMIDAFKREGFEDISNDLEAFLQWYESTEETRRQWAEKLSSVMRSLEYYESGDITREGFIENAEEYRGNREDFLQWLNSIR